MLVTGISLLKDVMLCTANSGAKSGYALNAMDRGDGGKLILNVLERDFFSLLLYPVV